VNYNIFFGQLPAWLAYA